MVQLRFLSGSLAGQRKLVRQFPFRLGRSPQSGLPLAEPGVWEQHCELTLSPEGGVHIVALGEALLAVNGETVRSARLRNGDLLDVGGVRLRFALSDAPLRHHRLRAALVWLALGAVLAGQLALIVRFAR